MASGLPCTFQPEVDVSEGSGGEGAFARLVPQIIGTKVGDLLPSCPDYHRATPPDPPSGVPIAIALSGGGFRATLSSLGVLRFLADAGLLEQVRYVSSVSGGSIANALFAGGYEALERSGFATDRFDDVVLLPTLGRIAQTSMSDAIIRDLWRALGPATRTTILADTLDDWFFGGMKLHALPPPCRYIFNAANLSTGVRFGFERETIGDYVLGTVSSAPVDLRVADAVAASAAVPGVFPAYTPKARFPCGNGLRPKLVDGGAYENTGMEPIDNLDGAFLVVLNAGGIFRPGPFGGLPIVRDLQRSESLLYRQSTALRMRNMVSRFKAWEAARKEDRDPPTYGRRGVLFALESTVDAAADWVGLNPAVSDAERLRLAGLKTSFARFSAADARQLVYQGWWLTGACISTYHRDLIDGDLPVWRPL